MYEQKLLIIGLLYFARCVDIPTNGFIQKTYFSGLVILEYCFSTLTITKELVPFLLV